MEWKRCEKWGAYITWMQVGIVGSAGPGNSSSSTWLNLSTSSVIQTVDAVDNSNHLMFKLICSWAPPPYIHLAPTWRHSSDECSKAFPHCCSSAFRFGVLLTEEHKWGRHVECTISSIVHRCPQRCWPSKEKNLHCFDVNVFCCVYICTTLA